MKALGGWMIGCVLGLTVVLMAVLAFGADIKSIDGGYLTFQTPDTNLYYTVEARPHWGGTSVWDGSYRGLQDLRSAGASLTVPVGVFYRVIGSPIPLHTRWLSPTTTVVATGYYDATNLLQVAPNLRPENIRAGVSIFGVNGMVLQSAGDALAEHVLVGHSFSRSDAVDIAGTMVNVGAQQITPGTAFQSIAHGYHDGSGSVSGDPNLVSANIRSGTTIFGVPGDAAVVDTSSGTAGSGDILIGKTAWVDGSEIMGSGYPAPVAKTSAASSDAGVAWPSPRFSVGSDTNVVIDHLTGLMWVRDASYGGTNTWDGALAFCSDLNHGGHDDWRLPSRFELDSLIDLGRFDPALPLGHPFVNVQLGYYWSSTPRAGGTVNAWYVNIRTGDGFFFPKSNTYNVWPVRGIELK